MNGDNVVASGSCRQVQIEHIGIERSNRRHQFGYGFQTRIERLERGQLILRHASTQKRLRFRRTYQLERLSFTKSEISRPALVGSYSFQQLSTSFTNVFSTEIIQRSISGRSAMEHRLLNIQIRPRWHRGRRKNTYYTRFRRICGAPLPSVYVELQVVPRR